LLDGLFDLLLLVVLRIGTILATDGDGSRIERMREFPVRSLASAYLLEAGNTKILEKLSDFP